MAILCATFKGQMDKGGHYYVQMIRVDAKEGIMMCRIKRTDG